MKRKFNGLMALWLVLALVAAMVLPVAATSEVVYQYIGSDTLQVGDDVTIMSNFTYGTYTYGNKLDTVLNKPTGLPEYKEFDGWNVWTGHVNTGASGVNVVTLTKNWGKAADNTTYNEAQINAFLDALPDNVERRIVFEPSYIDSRVIDHKPTASEPWVTVKYPDGATYQWYSTDDEGATGTEVSGETTYTLSTADAGDYYCVITWPDGYSLTSDTIRYSGSDNELWGWNPLIVLLLLKRSIRYYDGDKRVDIYKISELGVEIVEPLKLEDKDGMTLEGWYIDKELTEKFDFTKPVEKGIALYAKWVPIETTEEVQ